MLEILKTAFDRPQAITQNRHQHLVNKGHYQKYFWDFYPIGEEYYHEFNPYFVHLVPNEKLFPEFKVFTVRDGMYTFADFLLKHVKEIPKWKTTFLIPEAYAPILPPQLKGQFLGYSLAQNSKPEIEKAKKVVIFALLCDQYFHSYAEIEKKLSILKKIPKDVKIEVCFTLRKSPLNIEDKENLHYLKIPDLIRKFTGNHEITWIRLKDLMEKTMLKDTYLLDLIHDFTLTSDSFLHYFFLNKGGMVNSLPVVSKHKSLFDIDLSFHHKLQVNPLPEVSSGFVDLLFFAKMNRGEFWNLPKFHAEVRKYVTSSGYHAS